MAFQSIVPVDSLVGFTFSSIIGMEPGSECVAFTGEDASFEMLHMQECCECVYLLDVCGDVEDLVGSPIISASERTSDGREGSDGDSFTWTFYRISTAKGTVTLRWYGTSNGWYSESVYLFRTDTKT